MSARTRTIFVAALTVLAQLTVLLAVAPGVTAVPPATALYQDADEDGLLDQVEMTFVDALLSKIRPDEFTITCSTPDCPTALAIRPHSFTLTGASKVLTLMFNEDPRMTGGAIPDLTYDADAGTLKYSTGDAVATIISSTIEEVDDAAPILLGITGTSGSRTLVISFSEPVVAPDGDLVDVLDYQDVDSGSSCDDGAMNELRADDVDVGPSTTSTDEGVLDLYDEDEDDFARAFRFDLNDGDDQATTTIEAEAILPEDFDCDTVDLMVTNPLTDWVDAAGNAPLDGRASSAIVEFGVASIDAGQGSDEVTVTFTGGAESIGGGVLQSGAFQFIQESDADGTGSGAGITSGVHHTQGMNVVRLILSKRLNAVDTGEDDAGNDGANIQVGSNVRQVSGGSMSAIALPINDATAPELRSLLALDADLDGKLDLAQLVFNEGIDDSQVTSAGFTVKVDGVTIPTPQVATSPSCLSGSGITSTVDDHLVYLCLSESQGTGDRLTVIYDEAGGVLENPSGQAVGDFDRVSLDGARPVLTSALTLDTDTDGKIDAYQLGFSEGIRDTLMPPNDWTVTGRSVLVLETSLTGACALAPAGTNDNCVILRFVEGSTPDTADKPTLLSVGSPVLRDVAGNRLQAVTATSVVERDGAAPIILRVEGASGASSLAVTFSEPVQKVGSIKGALIPGSFAFNNVNGASPDQVASVSHQAGGSDGNKATVTLNGLMQPSDVTQDTLGVANQAVQEVTTASVPSCGGGDPATTGSRGACVSVVQRSISVPGAVDQTSPAAIGTLNGTVTSTTLLLRFAGVGDDGTTGVVTGYQVRVSSAPITETNFASLPSPSATFTPAGPGFAAPGADQYVMITGLTPGTKYYVGVRAYDESQNNGEISLATFQLQEKDTVLPGKVGALAVSNPTADGVTLTWVATGDDGAIGTVTSYQIRASTTVMDTAVKVAQVTPLTTVTFTPATLAKAGVTQSATVTGLTSGLGYFFAVTAIDDGGNAGDAAASTTSVKTTGIDITPPGAISDLEIAAAPAVSASQVALTWKAPADDGATGGSVVSYVVKYSTAPITDDTAFNTASTALDVTFTPAILAGPTVKQDAVVKGLQADTTYYFAVKARDEVATNLGGLSNIVSQKTLKDVTAPTGALRVSCQAPDLDAGQVNCSWTGLTDTESGLKYAYKMDRTEDTGLTKDSLNQTISTFAVLNLLGDGKYYVHVIGFSAGGVSTTAHGNFTVAGLEVTDEEVSEANEDLQSKVVVDRDGSAVVVSWEAPESPPGVIAGYQVWCGDGSDFDVVAEAEADADEVTVPEPCSGGQYIVTMHYEDGEQTGLSALGDPDDIEGFSGLEAAKVQAAPKGFPWMWVVLGAAVLVVLVLVGLTVTMLKRRSGAAVGEEGEAPWPGEEGGAATAPTEGAWPEAGGEEAPLDSQEPAAQEAPAEPAAEELPSHNVTCPKCKTPFTAQGQKPLQIECPNCHVRGMLR